MCVSGSRLRCRLQDHVHVQNDVKTRWTAPDCIRSRPNKLCNHFRQGVGKFHNPFTLNMLKAMPFCKSAQTRHWPFRFSPFCGKIFPQYCPQDRFSRQQYRYCVGERSMRISLFLEIQQYFIWRW